ncbi:MAG: 23S rRNA pseudouridine2604 synthase [Motiliproteus sp.]|jgi:23S rRNA pseudouridine2604 synthase
MLNSDSGMRLNKYISDSGFCSRREADKLIEQRQVRINGKPAELGTRVGEDDEVRVDGRLIKASAVNKSDRIYIVYNKPIGITCTTEANVKGNIVDAIGHRQRIFPIGRLDKPSEGLIFLTSDGDIVNKILRAENAHDKEYLVSVDKPVSQHFIDKMCGGVPILDTVTEPCKAHLTGRFEFNIVLTQGLNRQIRRMCEFLGYNVTKLKRVRIMSVSLGKLKPGQWRDLSPKELEQLNSAVSGSQKTAASSAEIKSSPKKAPVDSRSRTAGKAVTKSVTKAATKTPASKKTARKAPPGQQKPAAKSRPATRPATKGKAPRAEARPRPANKARPGSRPQKR